MITEQTIYWITRLDYIREVCLIFGIASFSLGLLFFIAFITVLSNLYEIFDDLNIGKRLLIHIFVSFVLFLSMTGIFIIVRCFVPTTQEALVMYALPEIINNKTIPSEYKDWCRTTKDFIKSKMETKDK